jgi:putative oxidoreductase
MSIAVGKVHWGKPIWGTEGGAELPVTNMAVGLALAFTIPGRYSLDDLLGVQAPRALVALVGAGVAAGIAVGLSTQPAPAPESPQAQVAGDELQAGQDASAG